MLEVWSVVHFQFFAAYFSTLKGALGVCQVFPNFVEDNSSGCAYDKLVQAKLKHLAVDAFAL